MRAERSFDAAPHRSMQLLTDSQRQATRAGGAPRARADRAGSKVRRVRGELRAPLTGSPELTENARPAASRLTMTLNENNDAVAVNH